MKKIGLNVNSVDPAAGTGENNAVVAQGGTLWVLGGTMWWVVGDLVESVPLRVAASSACRRLVRVLPADADKP
jgi:hypothetical protein